MAVLKIPKRKFLFSTLLLMNTSLSDSKHFNLSNCSLAIQYYPSLTLIGLAKGGDSYMRLFNDSCPISVDQFFPNQINSYESRSLSTRHLPQQSSI
jgi:hypothetical protein